MVLKPTVKGSVCSSHVWTLLSTFWIKTELKQVDVTSKGSLGEHIYSVLLQEWKQRFCALDDVKMVVVGGGADGRGVIFHGPVLSGGSYQQLPV